MNWPRPSNTHEVRSFIGLCSYYHRFVPGFAQNANFKWTEECGKVFQMLKDHLTKAPVLAYPDFDKPFILDTDVAIGATLSQIVDGEEHPIDYFSRTLTGPEKQYCVTQRELLAIVHAASHFHPYLYGNQFALTTPRYSGYLTLKIPRVKWRDGFKSFNNTTLPFITVEVDFMVTLMLYPEDLAKKLRVSTVRNEKCGMLI